MSDETTQTTPVEWTGEFDGDATKAGRRLQGPKLDAAKQAIASIAEAHSTLDGVVRWAAYEDETDAMEKSLVALGGELKYLGETSEGVHVGGYIVMFGDPEHTDLSRTRDFFTKSTDFDLDDDNTGRGTVYFHHRQPLATRDGGEVSIKRKIGKGKITGIDEVGVLVDAIIFNRTEYEKAIADNIKHTGWSSGTAPHLVEREAQANGAHKITRWPLGADLSITPIPAEPRTRVLSMKSYLAEAEPYVKALSQDAALQAVSTEATAAKAQPDQPIETETGVYDMTPEEIQALIAQTSEATIKAYEAKLAAEPAINPAGFATSQPATVKSKPEEFKTLGEQLIAVKTAALGYGYDRRLDNVKAILGGNESIPSEGGFLVHTAEDSGLDKKVWDSGVFANRATAAPIPAGANSASYYGLSENSRANGSRFGGITGYRVAEGATITASGPQTFYQYTLRPKKYAAVAYLTDEVLNDARALEAELSSGVPQELAFMVDDDMLNGLGVAGAHGVLNHASLITVTKEVGQAAATIVYQNLLKMWVRRYPRGSYTWFINQECEPQLDLLYQAVGTSGIPANFVTLDAQGVTRIKGAPVVTTEFNAALGTVGDIMLIDWSQYKLATIGGVNAASSMHVQFLTDQMCYRFTRRVDGLPTWQSVLTPYKGTSNTMSPFIALETRS